MSIITRILQVAFRGGIRLLRNLSVTERLIQVVLNRRASSSGGSDVRTVVFFQIFPAAWPSVMPIFEKIAVDERFRVFVLACPTVDEIGSGRIQSAAYKFFAEEVGNENFIGGYDYSSNEWFDLRELRPDYVFYNRPYNSEIPNPRFRSSIVSKYCAVCFLHYGYSLSNEYSKFWANESFIYYASHIFAEHRTKEGEYSRVLRLQRLLGLVKIHNVGYPRFELLQRNPVRKRSEETLWIPRWSVDDSNPDSTSFLNMIWPLIEFYSVNPQLRLVCRPHPKMFGSMLLNGALSAEEHQRIVGQVSELPNIEFDDHPNYVSSVQRAEVLLADYSALIADFFYTRKPIIYLGKSSHFNKEASLMAETFYRPSTNDSIFQLIERLCNGDDPLKDKREKLCDSLARSFDGASDRIIAALEASG